MKNCKKLFISFGVTFTLLACNSGGSGSNSEPNPYPYPAQGSYNGTSFDQLPQPSDSPYGVLANNYPSSYLPKFATSVDNNLKIAYGRNDESMVSKIAAYVSINGNEICSATPVAYDINSNTTFLVGAAHCFVMNKTSPTNVESADLATRANVMVSYGVNARLQPYQTYSNANVYVLQNYCYSATFVGAGKCPNYSIQQRVANGQGNDIAIIQVTGEFAGSGARNYYPQVVTSAEYPQTYAMAPILSIGYGVNTQSPSKNDKLLPRSTMYYVAGYQYATSSNTGYYYLYNSFYNNNVAFGKSGYTDLVCGGDSGGGDLFWTGTKWILLSEHTYGPLNSCGNFYKSLPNGATNVSAYYEWIESIISAGANAKANCQNGTIANCVTNN